ncbi:MAG: hypothetical protein RIT32_923 [Actinomycetota bacterium]|jgi:nucleoside-diphosphate-sugar epimerase
MVSEMKLKVLVTGSAGLLGGAICDLLTATEVPFQTLDLNPKSHPGSANHFIGLATDQQLLTQAMAGVNAVIHLAAIRNPNYGTPVAVFSNALATFTVLDAASSAGVNRAVIASSFSATGLPFGDKPIELKDLPIDESFVNQVSDPYALSKNIDELTAKYMTDRFGMRVVAIRYPYIGDHIELLPKRFEQIAADSSFGKKELWTYIDTRDAAYVAVDSVLNDDLAAGNYFVSASNLLGPIPAAELVKQHYPAAKLAAGHGRFDSLVDFSKATAGLRFQPQHNFPNEPI